MAYIESFRVEGLAGRSDVVERRLDRFVNVFWGFNGAGKTSLLKILSSALTNDVSLLTHVAFTSAEVTFRSIDHDVSIRRTISAQDDEVLIVEEEEANSPLLEDLGDGLWREVDRQPEFQWTTEVLDASDKPRQALSTTRFKHTYLPISRVSATRASAIRYGDRRSAASQAIDDAALSNVFAEQVRTKWQAYNTHALSQIRRTQQQGLATILAVLFGGAKGEMDSSTPTESGEHAHSLVSSFLLEQRIELGVGQEDFISRYDSERELQHVVGKIQDVTNEVEAILRPQKEFQEIVEKLYAGKKHLVFNDRPSVRAPLQVRVGDKELPLQSLSSGEKQLLQLMLETLAADANTVMIDEPELSMHVGWQQKLVESMRRVNPECQLLLASHSPEIMAEVSDELVFEL